MCVPSVLLPSKSDDHQTYENDENYNITFIFLHSLLNICFYFLNKVLSAVHIGLRRHRSTGTQTCKYKCDALWVRFPLEDEIIDIFIFSLW